MLSHILPLGQARLLIENGTTVFESLIVGLAYFMIFNLITIKYFEKCDLK